MNSNIEEKTYAGNSLNVGERWKTINIVGLEEYLL